MGGHQITSVAIIGAGASGAAAAAAFSAEQYFDRIKVFERRETPGGTWIYDPDPGRALRPTPGQLPPDADPPLSIPEVLPTTTAPCAQERFEKTPVYSELTTNVPAIAMSFSDSSFPYGPFVPHWIPKQHVQEHFSRNRTDSLLALNTTVESMVKVGNHEQWALTLRCYDPTRQLDRWWKEEFDAVVLCNGHYTVPYIPHVPGLAEYMDRYPDKVLHSKSYRTASTFAGKSVMVIGNSASGIDITSALVTTVQLPVYQSRRSRSRWDGDEPPEGVAWKPIITSFCAKTGDIFFADGSVFKSADLDHVVYCTGYKSSFPFWRSKANRGPLWDYAADRLVGNYLHTFFSDHPTLGIVGMPRTLTFRSFEYQAIALARVFAERNKKRLPSRAEMKRWEDDRAASMKRQRKKFHDIPWDNGETMQYLEALYEIAGLPELGGDGLCPPILDAETRWALEHVRKYPEPGKDSRKADWPSSSDKCVSQKADPWVVVESRDCVDSLHFV